jgi:hypothetical protein
MLQIDGSNSGAAGVVIDLDNGNVVGSTGPHTPQKIAGYGVVKHIAGWYRIFVKFKTFDNTIGRLYFYPAFCETTLCAGGESAATGNVFAWGAQVEFSSEMSSYYPTHLGSPLGRRAAESLSTPLSNVTGFNPSVGTFQIEMPFSGSAKGATILKVGNASNSIEIYGNSSGPGELVGKLIYGGTPVEVTSAFSNKLSGTNRVSISYNTGASQVLRIGNNGLPAASTPVSISPPSVSGLSLYLGNGGSTPTHINGVFKKIIYWPYQFGAPGIVSSTMEPPPL